MQEIQCFWGPGVKSPTFNSPKFRKPFDRYDTTFITDDLLGAIGELNAGSTYGPDGIHVIPMKSNVKSFL